MYIHAPRSGSAFRAVIERLGARVVLRLQRLLPDEVLNGLRKTTGSCARRINGQTPDFAYQIVFTPRKNSGMTLTQLCKRLNDAMPAVLGALPPLVVAAVVRFDPKLSPKAYMLAKNTVDLLGNYEFTKRENVYTILWRGLDNEPPEQIAKRLKEELEQLPSVFACEASSTESGVPSYLIKPPEPRLFV